MRVGGSFAVCLLRLTAFLLLPSLLWAQSQLPPIARSADGKGPLAAISREIGKPNGPIRCLGGRVVRVSYENGAQVVRNVLVQGSQVTCSFALPSPRS